MRKKLVILIIILAIILCLTLAWYADRMNVVPTQPTTPSASQTTSTLPSDTGIDSPPSATQSGPATRPSEPLDTGPSEPGITTNPTEPTTSPTEPDDTVFIPGDIENGLGWG